jgi:hypothetical protein
MLGIKQLQSSGLYQCIRVNFVVRGVHKRGDGHGVKRGDDAQILICKAAKGAEEWSLWDSRGIYTFIFQIGK